MGFVFYFLCFLSVIGMLFSDVQATEQYLTESKFNDALVQLFEKIADSEKRISSQLKDLSTAMQENVSYLSVLMPLTDRERNQKFFAAVNEGDKRFVRTWIRQGLSLNEKDPQENSKTALHKAIQFKHSEILKDLLNAGANTNQKDNNQETPLHFAVWKGNLEVVDRLIKAGANPNETESYGSTPLHFAAYRGHPEIVKTLLRAGASDTIRNRRGQTPMERALDGYNPEVAKLFSTNNV